MNAETEDRNDWGFPPIEVTAQERANQTTQIDQSVNKALPYVAWSWLLSGLALGGLLVLAMLTPKMIDTGVAKAKAEAQAAAAQELAAAKADMHLAETNALLAKDRTDKMAAALESRGLIKLENH